MWLFKLLEASSCTLSLYLPTPEATVDPAWGDRDQGNAADSDSDDDNGSAAQKKRQAKGLSSAKARLMSNSDVKDLMKLGDPKSSSTKVGNCVDGSWATSVLTLPLRPLYQRILGMVVPDEGASADDGDIARELALLPAVLGRTCCGVSRHDCIVALSVRFVSLICLGLLVPPISFYRPRRTNSPKCA